MKNLLQLLLFLAFPFSFFAQTINTDNILILRDEYGVPYIYTETDAEAAYALAWVQSEDNFYDVQEAMLGANQLLASVKGKDGALLDAFSFIVNAEKTVEDLYETALSDDFKVVLNGYMQGLNKYALTHPKEVRHKKLFPMSEKDIMNMYAFNMTFISNVQYDLIRILENKLDGIKADKVPSGSNGIAISPKRSADGKTYLVSNSHQPLYGFASWYEVQVNSNEGWNFHGATFAAGITPFVGTNKHLGWTHTVNFDDFHDVYELEMHPTEKLKYKFDGEWLDLEKRRLKLKVKLPVVPFPIPVGKNFYNSKYGTVIKNKSGFYAIRFPANMVLGAAEQWYKMNKATNFEEFNDALKMQQMASLNVQYADKEGNIMFVGNGLFPKERHPDYNWRKIVPGNTSKTLWEPNFVPFEELNIVTNPNCGYVFNSNNTGFDCTCFEENPNPEDFPKTMGYQTGQTARKVRFHELIDVEDKISYEKLKEIKYDLKFPFPLYTRAIKNLDYIRQIDEKLYPDIADVILMVKKWDGSVKVENRQAAIISLSIQHILKYLRENKISELNNIVPEIVFVEALQFAKAHLLKHFGKLDIELGELQKHVRGDVELPLWGAPEALAQMYTKPYEKGLYKGVLGESFILFATYNEDGVEKIETINCFGSSNRPESKHYTDQMQLFVDQKLRTVYLDKDENMKRAETAYRPE